jgi:hypothetical protein
MKIRGRTPLSYIAVACLLVVSAGPAATAQTLPSEPIVIGDGVVTLGGDVTASFGTGDPGFFNYTDYKYSSLRRLRAALTGRIHAGDRVSVLGELRMETALGPQSGLNTSVAQSSVLYARIRPWGTPVFSLQIGRLPPTFGAFTRRAYASDNPLIGYPLGYQYLTSLRSDAVPAHADELLRMRGRGWLSSFSIGDHTQKRGVPLAAALRWDTGIQLHAANERMEATASLTTGTLANPLVKEDNAGRQLAGRFAVHPATGLILGTSGSQGPFLSTAAARAAGGGGAGSFTQTAWGADAEYSRGHLLVRAEAIASRWRLPMVSAPFIDRPLRATTIFVEGRYRVLPGVYGALRVERLGFSTITGSAGPRAWDAPVTRVEAGGGYSLQRNLLLKLSYQFDKREETRVPRSHLAAAEVVFWF